MQRNGVPVVILRGGKSKGRGGREGREMEESGVLAAKFFHLHP
jgi:hypothetical protein